MTTPPRVVRSRHTVHGRYAVPAAIAAVACAILLFPPPAGGATGEMAIGTSPTTVFKLADSVAAATVTEALAPPAAPLSARPRALWQWPVRPPEAQRFFLPPAAQWAAGHRGVDLVVRPGDDVKAPADGQVTYAERLAGRGVLVISHANGLRSTFEPVDFRVAVGDVVSAGQTVGVIADPGVSSGSHCAALGCLHWGVIEGQTYHDPLSFLRGPVVLVSMWQGV